jgi:hypothetical protein
MITKGQGCRSQVVSSSGRNRFAPGRMIVSVPAWPSAQPAIFRGECASLWRSVRPMPGWIGAA